MAIGFIAMHLLMTGKLVVQKCAVLVSVMMEDLGEGVGGPTDLDAKATRLQFDWFLGNPACTCHLEGEVTICILVHTVPV